MTAELAAVSRVQDRRGFLLSRRSQCVQLHLLKEWCKPPQLLKLRQIDVACVLQSCSPLQGAEVIVLAFWFPGSLGFYVPILKWHLTYNRAGDGQILIKFLPSSFVDQWFSLTLISDFLLLWRVHGYFISYYFIIKFGKELHCTVLIFIITACYISSLTAQTTLFICFCLTARATSVDIACDCRTVAEKLNYATNKS